jgi:hypothetical protein
VFDETNDTQLEQFDLDVVNDEEAPCDALRRIVIDDIAPQDPNDPQANPSPNEVTPPTQKDD